MALDHDFMRHLLEILEEKYPSSIVQPLLTRNKHEQGMLSKHAAYLCGFGLIQVEWNAARPPGTSWPSQIVWAKLTHEGQDFMESASGKFFLANGGGSLGEVLKVKTFKLHHETLKALISERILATEELTPAQKQDWLVRLQSLPVFGIEHLVHKMVDACFDNFQKALPLLRNILG